MVANGKWKLATSGKCRRLFTTTSTKNTKKSMKKFFGASRQNNLRDHLASLLFLVVKPDDTTRKAARRFPSTNFWRCFPRVARKLRLLRLGRFRLRSRETAPASARNAQSEWL